MNDLRKHRAPYVVGIVLGAVLGAAVVGPSWTASAGNGNEAEGAAVEHPEPAAPVAFSSFPRNMSGMTYGSGLQTDDKNPGPDLIAAVGVDGTYGYVRAKDRDANSAPPANPAEAANMAGKRKSDVIPLYDVDGKTVIGEFQIQVGLSGSELGS